MNRKMSQTRPELLHSRFAAMPIPRRSRPKACGHLVNVCIGSTTRPRAVLVLPKGERLHPRRALRCRVHLHDAADDGGIGEDIVIVVVPLAEWAARRCALEDRRGHFARLLHIARRPRQLAGAESPAPDRSHALADARFSRPSLMAASTATTKQ